MPDVDIAGQWASFDAPKRQRLLARMNADQKAGLRRSLEAAGHSAQPVTAPAATPATAGEAKRTLTQRFSDFVDNALPNRTAEEMSAEHFPGDASRKAGMLLRPVANAV